MVMPFGKTDNEIHTWSYIQEWILNAKKVLSVKNETIQTLEYEYIPL